VIGWSVCVHPTRKTPKSSRPRPRPRPRPCIPRPRPRPNITSWCAFIRRGRRRSPQGQGQGQGQGLTSLVGACSSYAEDAELRGAVRSSNSGARLDDDVDAITAVQLGGHGQETVVANLTAQRRLRQIRRPASNITAYLLTYH